MVALVLINQDIKFCFQAQLNLPKQYICNQLEAPFPYKRHFQCVIRISMLQLCAPMLELFWMAYCEHCLPHMPFWSALFWESFTIDLCPGAVIMWAQHSHEMAKLFWVQIQWSHYLTQFRIIGKLVNAASTSSVPAVTVLQYKCLSFSAGVSSVADHNIDLCGGEMAELRITSLQEPCLLPSEWISQPRIGLFYFYILRWL